MKLLLVSQREKVRGGKRWREEEGEEYRGTEREREVERDRDKEEERE